MTRATRKSHFQYFQQPGLTLRKEAGAESLWLGPSKKKKKKKERKKTGVKF
jgi:hypothetical protein